MFSNGTLLFVIGLLVGAVVLLALIVKGDRARQKAKLSLKEVATWDIVARLLSADKELAALHARFDADHATAFACAVERIEARKEELVAELACRRVEVFFPA